MRQGYDEPLLTATTNRRAARRKPIEIALVNNMPDPAMAATEAQFSRLLQAGAGAQAFRLRCYRLPSVPRGEATLRQLSETYETIDHLYARGADALIVTGAEPRAAALPDEPYWRDLSRLLDWARENTMAALWSCLAAHAAVELLDGITRRRAAQKLTGLYRFETCTGDFLMNGAGSTVLVPHSRYNGLDPVALQHRGYHISSQSEAAGVDLFWRCEPSLFVFAQGHPEYFANTLAREYRRDVLRYLSAPQNPHPPIPANYFSAKTQDRLEALRQQALRSPPPGYDEALDEILSNEAFKSQWDDDAVRLYRKWLAHIQQEAGLEPERDDAGAELLDGESGAEATASS
ncbi:MAG TPA: homoserine O-succinyltransferase [Methylocella sp.]|nr:homoserine O-succinyltransferase [Methylocella sp.]